MVIDLMGVWESGEVGRLEDLLSADVVYEDVPNGVSLQGLEAATGYVGHVHAWASDIEILIDRTFGSESEAVAEWTMTAVQSSPIPGRLPVATDRRITLKGVTLVEVRQGKIVRAADYMDTLGFVLQLGGEVALPGEVVLKLPEEAVETPMNKAEALALIESNKNERGYRELDPIRFRPERRLRSYGIGLTQLRKLAQINRPGSRTGGAIVGVRRLRCEGHRIADRRPEGDDQGAGRGPGGGGRARPVGSCIFFVRCNPGQDAFRRRVVR